MRKLDMTAGWWLQRVLWIDGLAALSAGVFVLALRGVLARRYVLPIELVTIIAVVNLSYSALSLTLAARAPSARPLALVVSLAVANCFWACVCTFLVMRYWSVASFLGLAHIAFEGVSSWRSRRSNGGTAICLPVS